jgi:hypothetical protein
MVAALALGENHASATTNMPVLARVVIEPSSLTARSEAYPTLGECGHFLQKMAGGIAHGRNRQASRYPPHLKN